MAELGKLAGSAHGRTSTPRYGEKCQGRGRKKHCDQYPDWVLERAQKCEKRSEIAVFQGFLFATMHFVGELCTCPVLVSG